ASSAVIEQQRSCNLLPAGGRQAGSDCYEVTGELAESVRYACTVASAETGMVTSSPTRRQIAPRTLTSKISAKSPASCHLCPMVISALRESASDTLNPLSITRYGTKQ